jgi:hypothetical protein
MGTSEHLATGQELFARELTPRIALLQSSQSRGVRHSRAAPQVGKDLVQLLNRDLSAGVSPLSCSYRGRLDGALREDDPQKRVKNAATTHATRTSTRSTPKYPAIPPAIPATIRSWLDRVSSPPAMWSYACRGSPGSQACIWTQATGRRQTEQRRQGSSPRRRTIRQRAGGGRRVADEPQPGPPLASHTAAFGFSPGFEIRASISSSSN